MEGGGEGIPVRIDSLMARAVNVPRTRFAQARTRRFIRRIEVEYTKALAGETAVGAARTPHLAVLDRCRELLLLEPVHSGLEAAKTTPRDRDPATGLFARQRFTDAVDRAQRFGAGAVLIVRVEPADRPPAASGQSLGTALVRLAAKIFEDLRRPDDRLGRVGPSEIAVLLPDTSLDHAGRMTETLVRSIRAATVPGVDGPERLTAWAGLVRYSHDAQASSHELLIDAEGAWHRAREIDTPAVWLAHPIRASDRVNLCRDRIATALRTDHFTLFAQPIRELASGTVTRYELLLRVKDDMYGPLSPVAILDAAERLDSVFDIDLWVLERAVEMITSGPEDLHFQVNLSGRSLGDARLAEAVDELFRRHPFAPGRLTFELTETAVVGNVTEALRFANRVREIGCQLALDDFGSGYGSFRYLKMFPVDLVKIDGEFIENLVTSPEDQVMVRAIVLVCRAYGITAVAEWVQDEPTVAMLRELGVEFAQGYLIGEPEPIDDGWWASRARSG